MHASLLEHPLYTLAALLALGVFVQWCAARFRFPAVVLLLGTGLLIGPGLGLLDPKTLFGPLLEPLVGLAVGFVLFEGGLSLHLREARRLGWPLIALVLGALVITFLSSAFLCHHLAGLSWGTSLTIGAILIVTGPTVIRPMLRQARLARRPALLLKWEGIVNDPLGALVGVVVVEVVVLRSGLGEPDGALWPIPLLILAAAALGSFAGYFFVRAMDRGAIPEHLKTPCMVGGVALVFAAGELIFHETGLLATTAMGVVFANVGSPNLENIRRFKENVTTMLVAMLFLVLSANLALSDLTSVSGGELAFVACVLLVVRPLTAWTSLAFSKLPWRERGLIGWIAPRGVVAAAMAATLQARLVEAGSPDAERMVPILFAVILATVVLHGSTVKPLAQALGLSSKRSDGLLVVGASRWVIDLTAALRRAGIETVVVDSDYRAVRKANLSGVEAHYGEILDEETLDELPVERLGLALAATTDDSRNALASVALHPVFGRENVAQLTPAGEHEDDESPLRGRLPWGPEGTFASIASRFWSGATFKVSKLTERYDEPAFRAQYPSTTVLFTVVKDRLSWFEGASLESGTTVVHMV